MRWPGKQTDHPIGQVFVSLALLAVLTITSFSHLVMAMGTFEIKLLEVNYQRQSKSRSVLPCDVINPRPKLAVCLSHHLLPPPIDPRCTMGRAIRHNWSTDSPVIVIPFSYTWSGKFTLSVKSSYKCKTRNGNTETMASQFVLSHVVSPSTTWTRVSAKPVEMEIRDSRPSNTWERDTNSTNLPGHRDSPKVNFQPIVKFTEDNDKNEESHQTGNSNSIPKILDFHDSDSDKMQIANVDTTDPPAIQRIGSTSDHRAVAKIKDSVGIPMSKSDEGDSSLIKLIGTTLNYENVRDEASIKSKDELIKLNQKGAEIEFPYKDYSDSIDPIDTSLDHVLGAMIVMLRIVCDRNYYGNGCILHCKPRDNFLGHFRCSDEGRKLCLPGWKGHGCNQAVCHKKCLPSRGYCRKPSKCTCLPGWHGNHCEECQTSRGCVHGYCHRPTQCICRKGWTGPNCDKEIDYDKKLCQNGGTRTSDKECLCPPGFTGVYCEFTLCEENHCKNNGSCLIGTRRPYCVCLPSYFGSLCQHQAGVSVHATSTPTNLPYVGDDCKSERNRSAFVNQCTNFTCLNNATCHVDDSTNRPYCACLSSFTGRICETNMNPCDKTPCRNEGKCIVEIKSDFNNTVGTRSLPGDNQYIAKCVCKDGFAGRTCDAKPNYTETKVNKDYEQDNQTIQELEECGSNCITQKFNENPLASAQTEDICRGGIMCQNGGKCIPSSRRGSFYCQCQGRWSGEFCETDETDPCASQVCLNGGSCFVEYDMPFCTCPSSFTGYYCEAPTALCSPTTCHHGGSCVEQEGRFVCVCRRNYFGDFCEMPSHSEELKVSLKVEITHSSRTSLCQTSKGLLLLGLLSWVFLKENR